MTNTHGSLLWSVMSRILIAAFVCLLMGILLYGMQIAIEAPETKGLKKFSLVILLILAGGFTWDTIKYLVNMPEGTYVNFRSHFGKSLGWFVLYIILGTVFQMLLGSWAGLWTIVSGFVLVAAFAAATFAILNAGKALDLAFENPKPAPDAK